MIRKILVASAILYSAYMMVYTLNPFIIDRYDHPIDPGIYVLENVEHELYEGANPESINIKRKDAIALVNFIQKEMQMRDTASLILFPAAAFFTGLGITAFFFSYKMKTTLPIKENKKVNPIDHTNSRP